MAGELGAALQSLKFAYDIAKGLNAANTQTAINEVKIDLQERIFEAREALSAAQSAETAALQRIGELEQEIMRLKDWKREKQRYELKPLRDGDDAPIAYALKESMANSEPAHWICANCYQDGQKSILQSETRNPGRTILRVCHHCGSELIVHGNRETPKVNRGSGSWNRSRTR